MNGSAGDFFLDDDPFDRTLADSFSEDFVELLWDNGPVLRRTPQEELRIRASSSAAPIIEEEEMSSWLHDQIGVEFEAAIESDQNSSEGVGGLKIVQCNIESRESTVVDSSVTREQRTSEPAATCRDSIGRKSAEGDDSDSIGESIDKQDESSGSASKKRQRAAEVHNLSERRRRDRINEKMKALQELVPGCNKSDKASMLDDAIRYMKLLKNHVQMMSMGCHMVPMMVPGGGHHHHHYLPQMVMPAMPMTMNMSMAMGSYGAPLISGYQATPSASGPLPFRPGPAPAQPNPPSSHSQSTDGTAGKRF